MHTKKINILFPLFLFVMGCNNENDIGFVELEQKQADYFINCTAKFVTDFESRMTIPSPASGKIIYVIQPASTVRTGTTIAKIENSEFIVMQQEYVDAVNMHEFYREEYLRQGDLTVENATSIKKMQLAKKDFQSAEIKMQSLALQLRLLGIIADSIKPGKLLAEIPVSVNRKGQLSRLYVQIGDYVKEGDPVAEIISGKKNKIRLLIPEQAYFKIKVGQSVVGKAVYDSLTVFSATIISISPEIESETGMAEAYAEIQDAPAEMISGMSFNAQISTGSTGFYLAPLACIRHDDQGDFILAKDNGKYFRIPAASNLQSEPAYRITSELTLDSVVCKGFRNALAIFKQQ